MGKLNRVFQLFVGNQYELAAEEIDCIINDEYKIGCRREGDEVFVPFSFIKKYFEVSFRVFNCFQFNLSFYFRYMVLLKMWTVKLISIFNIRTRK